mmetsp:Transcript_40584/g.122584  ORF Transcript_40584/g.122584 Transcript_40584/m.122584 type:complete len:321 (-) Transcript_40584:893-1855(-)
MLGKQHLAAVGQGAHLDVQVVHVLHRAQVPPPARRIFEVGDLLQQVRDHPVVPGAPDDPHGDRRVGEREARVRGPEGPREVLPRHHRRNVPLRGALRDGDDVHLRAAQRVEEAPADVRAVFHALPDGREDAAARHGRHPDLRVRAELHREGLLHARGRHRRVALVNGDRDRMLGRTLGCQDHVDARARQGVHHPPRHAVGAEEGCTRKRHQRDLLDRRDGLDRRAVVALELVLVLPAQPVVAPAVDARARVRWVEHVAHQHGNPLLDARDHGRGVEHLAAKIRQLHRLVEGHGRDGEGLGHPARVGGVDAIDVFPEDHAR